MRNTAVGRRGALCLFALALVEAGAAAAAPPLRRRPPRPARRLPVVAIDPGHGGIDPGAMAPDGVAEKDVTLATARDLAMRLAATRHFRVVLTRDDDEFVPLLERVARARAAHADLFVSIHADALPDAKKRGASVFTLSRQASDREAAALANGENRSDLVAGVNLSRQPREVGDVLFDLARRRTANLSLALARDLVAALAGTTALLERPRRAAGFVVLTAPDVPSALVELGCLSNPAEGRLLQLPAYQRRLAQGISRGIAAYVGAHPP